MRRVWIVIAGLFLSSHAAASGDPCAAPAVEVTIRKSDRTIEARLRSAIAENTHIKFTIVPKEQETDDFLELSQALTINSPKCISGLKIKPLASFSGTSLLLITSPDPVTISDATITGPAATCIDLRSHNARILSSEISGCDVGVKINANDALIGPESVASAADFDAHANKIHDNTVGIAVDSGTRNRFA